MEGKFKETVQGDSSCVDGSDTRGRKNDALLACILLDIAQKGTLSCAGLACEKEGMVSMADEVQCRLELWGAGVNGRRVHVH